MDQDHAAEPAGPARARVIRLALVAVVSREGDGFRNQARIRHAFPMMFGPAATLAQRARRCQMALDIFAMLDIMPGKMARNPE
jgi:hypothetical protein